jgi:hypothetical protein
MGYFMVTRDSELATSIRGSVNYMYITGTGTSQTTAIPNYSFYIGARNENSIPERYIDCQISVVFFSEYISEENNRKILNCIEYYMDSNGKGIIP